MKQFIFLLLVPMLLLGCSKGEFEDLSTSFQGIVIDDETNEPFTGGQIEVIGSEPGLGPYDAYRKTFQIESDGTFDIRVTTSNIDLFQIDVEGYQECYGPSITVYCTLMEAGKDHKDIRIMAGSVNPD